MKNNRILFRLLVCLCLMTLSVQAQTDYLAQARTLPNHPRLLLLEGEEKIINRTIESDGVWSSLNGAILAECDNLVSAAPLQRIQVGRRLLDKSREALRRLFFLSYAWRMTHQEKYRARAETELLAVSAFSDWNPSHFLDVAEMTMAVSIGYDWLYADLPESTRSAVREAILKKGIEPSLDPKNSSWLKATHNWNQVCNAGMAFGALAVYEDQPELARSIINRSIQSIVLPMGDYKPDGGYPEGYGYWGYGTSFNVMFISALEKAYRSDFGLAEQPGFLKTAGFMENMTGPSGNAFNYSDSGLGGELQPAMFWFAAKTQTPSLLWVERSRLTDNDPKTHVRNRLLPAALIWNNGMNISTLSPPASTVWIGAGRTPVALMRTSWTDPAAIYVAMKGGTPSTNHAHMDIGSFVMEADGVRWAMDFGMQNYESLESRKVDLWNSKQNSQRWQVFRYSNFVHNTLTINSSLQRVDGKAAITGSSANPLFRSAITDLTQVYRGALTSANRGIAIVDNAYVVVRDELETPTAETTVRWTLLTPATVNVIESNRAELTYGGKKLLLEVQEPATVTLKTWPTDPTHDYDAPNPGTVLVGFEVSVPPATKTALNVTLTPQRAWKQAAPKSLPLRDWPR